MNNSNFNFVPKEKNQNNEQTRPSLTYWKDAWRRLKKNKMSMIGLIAIAIIVLFAVVGPLFTPYRYSYQQLDYTNLPPAITLYEVDTDVYVYVTPAYRVLTVTKQGALTGRLEQTATDAILRRYTYDFNGEELIIDFSYKLDPAKADEGIDFSVTYHDVEIKQPYRTVWNKTFLFGSDNLGRDILTRLMYGARISLLVALVATLVDFFIGIAYGSISGLEGGLLDDIMMRIVDIINSIPLMLYVILLMVLLNDRGLGTIILTLGSVYWVGMARLVRGQVLGLKEQEFVLAARTLGVSKTKIIVRHLLPNALGPIIVSMTMMIPTAVFTESFLSFIGLGVSAPQASWGTLANDALGQLYTYPYQLFFPSMAIALTMLAFNFLGDGLRSALDPRLRKG